MNVKNLLFFAYILICVLSNAHADELEKRRIEEKFLSTANDLGTIWHNNDISRFANGLLLILEENKQPLGNNNYNVLNSYLRNYTEQMVKTVYSDIKPIPSQYIDAFLLDFEGRIKLLCKTPEPIFLDSNQRSAIKSLIISIVDQAFNNNIPVIVSDSIELNSIKEKFILELFWHEANPLRTEFKRVISPDKVEFILRKCEENLINANWDAEQLGLLSDDKKNILVRNRLWKLIMKPIYDNFHRTPLLITSQKAMQKYNEAYEVLLQKIDELEKEGELK